MTRRNGPWTINSTTELYRSEFIQVYKDEVTRPDGKPGSYGTVTMKQGVAVLPIDDQGRVYLTRQFRYALGKESVEVVSGGIDEDAPPQEAAERELHEELGISAAEWVDLGHIDMDTSIVRSPVALFAAKGLTFKEAETEGTETIKPLQVTLDEAYRMVRESEITHSPSCVLILKAYHLLREAGEGTE